MNEDGIQAVIRVWLLQWPKHHLVVVKVQKEK